MQLSTGAALGAAASRVFGLADLPAISNQGGKLEVTGPNYTWEYSQSDDTFTLWDSGHHRIVSGKMQPAVIVAPAAEPTLRQCTPGKPSAPRVDGRRVTVAYEGVNGNGRLSVTWRFDEHGIWTEPIVYAASTAHDVVSLHYFSDVKADKPVPTLRATYLVVPGISEADTVSPILRDYVSLNESVWLGRGSSAPGPSQQWGLPVHYFNGFSIDSANGGHDSFTAGRSAAFTCGLADLPGGDLFLQLESGKSGMWIDYRSDLWKHMRGPGEVTLGATLYWSIAPGYYEAIAAYYRGLLQAGVIRKSQPSAKKIAAALTPQFCAWTAEVDRNKAGDRQDEAFVTGTSGCFGYLTGAACEAMLPT